MDELVDILDETGYPTGETALKSEAHRRGFFHSAIHVWFYTSNGWVVIQQRSKEKDTHPLLWDVSVAGHIGAGETPELSAVREVQEEIGLTISTEQLEKIGVFKSVHKHREDLVDCEFHHSYLCALNVPLEALKRKESEVAALKLIPFIQLTEEIWGLANVKKYVPHETEYYATIIKAIKKKL